MDNRLRVLDDSTCRFICAWYLLGFTFKEIHEWVREEKGIQCSYGAIPEVVKRKRWKRFIKTLVQWEIFKPWIQEAIQEGFEKKWESYTERWNKLSEECINTLKLALEKHPPLQTAYDIKKAAQILRDLARKTPLEDFKKRLTELEQKISAENTNTPI